MTHFRKVRLEKLSAETWTIELVDGYGQVWWTGRVCGRNLQVGNLHWDSIHPAVAQAQLVDGPEPVIIGDAVRLMLSFDVVVNSLSLPFDPEWEIIDTKLLKE